MEKLELGGREFDLVFSMATVEDMEKEGYAYTKLGDYIKGESANKVVTSILRMMANESLERKGEAPDVTDRWMCLHMLPNKLDEYYAAFTRCLTAGRAMETADEDDDADHDVVLEELQKKRKRGS